MGKAITIIGFIIVSCLVTIGFGPGPTRPAVSLNLIDYTNDSAGVRLGMISVTNLGPSKVVIYVPCVEVRAPAEPGGVARFGESGHWYSMLGGGDSKALTIPAPPNGVPWRLSVLAFNDFGVAQCIRRVLRGRQMPCDIRSGWNK
jgi:hypothetical protein